MEQSPWEDNNHSASQEIPRVLCNPKVHYCVHKNKLLVPILSQMHPVRTFPPCFPKIHSILSSHLRLGLRVVSSLLMNFYFCIKCRREDSSEYNIVRNYKLSEICYWIGQITRNSKVDVKLDGTEILLLSTVRVCFTCVKLWLLVSLKRRCKSFVI
jgi:hypothetical protein